MKINFKRAAAALALAAGLALNGAAAHAVAAPMLQEQAPDYSKNKTYQQGVREGKDDKAHSRDHSKKRHFKKDDDQKAYEAGYQQGRAN
jgi:opacity protein-like surface antigen